MNQKLSLSLFFAGLPTFLTSLGEFLARHHSWTEMTHPAAVGHLVLMTGSFCCTIFGALGTQLPRDGRHADRVTDERPTTDVGSDVKGGGAV